MNEAQVVKDIVDIKADIADIKHNMATNLATKSDTEAIINSIDNLTKITLDTKADHSATIEWLKRHDTQIKKIQLQLRPAV